MGKVLTFLVLLANLMALHCQEKFVDDTEHPTTTGNPSYTFSYGVNDMHTGDVKNVWESKQGDTVQGHYSVLEPDGSTRTVDYSSHPKTGFTAIVNNDGEKLEQIEEHNIMEDKAMRDYDKFYDFSEDAEPEIYDTKQKKKGKHPFDTVFKDYSPRKRSKYPNDLESSEFSHSVTIKHRPRDQTGAESESHTHFGSHHDPNCKKKHKKTSLYTNVHDYDSKPFDFKHPAFSPQSYKDNYETYEASNLDFEKHPSPFGSKMPSLEGSEFDKYPFGGGSKGPKFEDFKPSQPVHKYKFPYVPDLPEGFYSEGELSSRPKRKRPHKKPEYHYLSDEVDDYWVPKKKKKIPTRFAEPDFLHEDDDFDHSRYPSDVDEYDDDERPYKGRPQKEVVRKIVKKKKPTFNLLDILDI